MTLGLFIQNLCVSDLFLQLNYLEFLPLIPAVIINLENIRGSITKVGRINRYITTGL